MRDFGKKKSQRGVVQNWSLGKSWFCIFSHENVRLWEKKKNKKTVKREMVQKDLKRMVCIFFTKMCETVRKKNSLKRDAKKSLPKSCVCIFSHRANAIFCRGGKSGKNHVLAFVKQTFRMNGLVEWNRIKMKSTFKFYRCSVNEVRITSIWANPPPSKWFLRKKGEMKLSPN